MIHCINQKKAAFFEKGKVQGNDALGGSCTGTSNVSKGPTRKSARAKTAGVYITKDQPKE